MFALDMKQNYLKINQKSSSRNSGERRGERKDKATNCDGFKKKTNSGTFYSQTLKMNP